MILQEGKLVGTKLNEHLARTNTCITVRENDGNLVLNKTINTLSTCCMGIIHSKDVTGRIVAIEFNEHSGYNNHEIRHKPRIWHVTNETIFKCHIDSKQIIHDEITIGQAVHKLVG